MKELILRRYHIDGTFRAISLGKFDRVELQEHSVRCYDAGVHWVYGARFVYIMLPGDIVEVVE